MYYWIKNLCSIETRSRYTPQDWYKDKRKTMSKAIVLKSRSITSESLELGVNNIERGHCHNSIDDLSRTDNRNESRVGTYEIKDIHLKT